MPEIDTEEQSTEDFNGAILFCPLCCTNIDCTDPKQTEFECITCGQAWEMKIDVERIAQHSVV